MCLLLRVSFRPTDRNKPADIRAHLMLKYMRNLHIIAVLYIYYFLALLYDTSS